MYTFLIVIEKAGKNYSAYFRIFRVVLQRERPGMKQKSGCMKRSVCIYGVLSKMGYLYQNHIPRPHSSLFQRNELFKIPAGR